MDIKVEISPKEITAKVETPNEPIYGGTKDYTKLDNLPSINGSVIIGDMTLLQLGIQPQGDYAERRELPVNVSELYNDAGYLVQSDLSDYAKTENIPTNVSQLENDSDYATTMQIPTKTSQLSNDSEFAYTKDIPTKVSQLENDSDYAAKSDLPTKTSQLLNDSNIAYVTDIPTKTSELNNDSNFAYVSDIPTKFSELENDSLKNVDNTSDENKPVSIAQRKAIDDAYANSNAYTDQKIADLIGGAPETLDTLKEVADAIAESKDVEEALNLAIGTKANQTELDTHTGNDTIHITSSERIAWNDANDKKHTHSNKSILDKITQTLIDNWNAAYTHISDTVRHITSGERTAWNNKYDKPTSGIPKSDLASSVQTSLGKADTALQSHQDISGLATKLELSNHVNNTENPHEVTAEQVGLGNCDNTSDANKPISKAQQAEFDNINSNLTTLAYDENAGGKNIWKYGDISNILYYELILKEPLPAGSYTLSAVITSSDTDSNVSLIRIMNESNDISFLYFNRNSRQEKQFTADSEFNKIVFYASNTYNNSVNDTFSASDIQLELGLGTDYKPYIPSVKMLAEENAQQNTEAMDLKMLGWTVPAECPIQNEVSGNQFIQKVGRIKFDDVSIMDIILHDTSLRIYNISGIKKSLEKNIYLDGYISETPKDHSGWSNAGDKIIGNLSTYEYIIIKDISCNSIDAFKTKNNGKYIYYALETPITMTIDGNEAVTKVNDSLGDYDLDNKFDGQLEYGSINTSNGNKDSGTGTNRVRTVNKHKCVGGSIISFKFITNISYSWVTFYFYAEDGTYLTNIDVSNGKVTSPNNAYSFYFVIGLTNSVSSLNVGDIRIYVDNAIDVLKNDLVSLKNLFSSNITGIKLNGTTLEVSFNNGTSKGKVTFDGIAEEETIIS